MLRPSQAFLPPFSLVLACFLWGGATVLNKALLGPLPPVFLLLVQLIPGVALFGTLTFVLKRALPSGGALWAAALLGLLNPGISYSLSMLGLARIPASVASLMWATEPVMILALASLFLKERVTWMLAGIVVLSLAGAALVAGVWDNGSESAPDTSGVILVLTAVFLCAIYTTFSRKLAADVDPVPLLAVQQGAGLIWSVLLVLVLPADRAALLAPEGLPFQTLATAAFTGFMYYGISYWLYLFALRHLPAMIAGSYFNIIPLVTVGLAFVSLGERLSPMQWTGAILILVAALLLVRETLRQSSER